MGNLQTMVWKLGCYSVHSKYGYMSTLAILSVEGAGGLAWSTALPFIPMEPWRELTCDTCTRALSKHNLCN